MNVSEVIKRLNDRRVKAENIINCKSQTATVDAGAQPDRSENLRLYKDEMEYLINSLEYIQDTPIHIVPQPTLKKKSAQADFASIEEDGYYFQLVLLRTYPFGKAYLLYVAPLSEL